jgi:hypothetical protein
VRRPHIKHYQDRLGQAGALELEKSIRQYWLERGHRIETVVEAMVGRSKNPIYTLRSNLLNGWPLRRSRVAAQPKNAPAAKQGQKELEREHPTETPRPTQ